MRILIYGINFHPEPTGIGKYTGEMAEWLAGRGHEVRVVTAPPFYPQWRVFPGHRAWNYSRERFRSQNSDAKTSSGRHAQGTDVEIFRCPLWIPENPKGLKRLFHLASFGLSSTLPLFRQMCWSPDIVLLVEPTLFCAPQALLLARWSGAKAWLHIQDFEVDAGFELGDLSSSRLRDWAFAFERRILSGFDRVSAISQRMIERLSVKGVDPARRVLFPNWVDTVEIYPLARPSPFREELDIAPSTVVALYSGSMGKKQGLDLLANAARRLSDRPGLRFVFCGEGPGQQLLVDCAKNLPNVSLLPVQPACRLNDLLNLADIHLLPQLADAADLVMPSKLTGMMASGRAIVATAHPGTQIFETLKGRGLAAPPGDVNSFAAALALLAEEPSLRARLGQAARSYAVAHLNREDVLREFERSVFSACGIPSLEAVTPVHAAHSGKILRQKRAMAAGNSSDD